MKGVAGGREEDLYELNGKFIRALNAPENISTPIKDGTRASAVGYLCGDVTAGRLYFSVTNTGARHRVDGAHFCPRLCFPPLRP